VAAIAVALVASVLTSATISAAAPGQLAFPQDIKPLRVVADGQSATAKASSVSKAAKKVKVTFKANGGKIGSKTSKSKTVVKGKKLGALPTAKRSGYTFKGWYTKKSGGKKITKTTKATKNITYWAHWQKKQTAPKLSWQRVTMTFTTAYQTYSFSYDKPVVSGVKAKVAKTVDSAAVKFYTNMVASLKKYDASLTASEIADCKANGVKGTLSGKRNAALIKGKSNSASIYKSRYLSVYLGVSGFSCDTEMGYAGSKTLNIDLKTGKSVPLSKFASNKGNALVKQLVNRAKAYGPPYSYSSASDIKKYYLGKDKKWTVSSKGVTVYFHWELFDDGMLVKWPKIKKP
jgi:uncharacterized repeat protein (TIGR02543 family)